MSENRDVDPGCFTLIFMIVLISALIGIANQIDKVATAIDNLAKAEASK